MPNGLLCRNGGGCGVGFDFGQGTGPSEGIRNERSGQLAGCGRMRPMGENPYQAPLESDGAKQQRLTRFRLKATAYLLIFAAVVGTVEGVNWYTAQASHVHVVGEGSILFRLLIAPGVFAFSATDDLTNSHALAAAAFALGMACFYGGAGLAVDGCRGLMARHGRKFARFRA